MSEELIYLKGDASGFFIPKSLNLSGNFKFHNIDFQTIDVRSAVKIDPFVVEELKIGLYHSSVSPIKDVRVFINENDYIQQTINDFLFTDIKIGQEVVINGEKNTEYTSTVYFIIKKIKLDTPIINTPFHKANDAINDGEELVDGKDLIKEGCDSEAESWFNEIKSYFNFGFLSVLKYIFFSFILFSFLNSLFRTNFWTLLIPVFYLLYHLLNLLKQKSRYTARLLQTNYPIFTYLGNFIIFLSLYYIFKHSISLIPIIFLILGLGLVLNLRVFRFSIILGRILILTALAIGSYFIYKSYIQSESSDNTNVPYDETDNDKWDYKPKEFTDTLNTENQDTVEISYLKHDLSWKDNYRKVYQAKISVRKDQCNIARIKRDRLQVNETDSRIYYGKVYANLINQNKDYLNSVVTEYTKICKSKQLSTKQFSDMVVTSIQNIPYCLVHELTHAEADEQGGYIREYHQTGGPCLDQTKFGIQAPVEFMGNFKGDCDTRSLFLYYVLSKLGFKVVVLVSEEYGHSILGISGNYSGDYIIYNGLKYYAWETTNTGFTPGNMNPEVGNMRYWKVALGNNN